MSNVGEYLTENDRKAIKQCSERLIMLQVHFEDSENYHNWEKNGFTDTLAKALKYLDIVLKVGRK